MYYISKIGRCRNTSRYYITDTADGVVEIYYYNDLQNFITEGIEIKGVHRLDSGDLMVQALNPKNFTDINMMGKIVPWDAGRIAMIIRYKDKENMDVLLDNGAIIKKTQIPYGNYLPMGAEIVVMYLQRVIEHLRAAAYNKKTVFTFSEAAALMEMQYTTLLNYYKRGEITSYKYGVFTKNFKPSDEDLVFSMKDIYTFVEKVLCKQKQQGFYTKEQLKSLLQAQTGMTDKQFLNRVDRYIPAIVTSTGAKYYSQTQLDFLRLMYERAGRLYDYDNYYGFFKKRNS